MNNKKSIDFEIGFSDSKIISYESKEDGLNIFLRSWNEKTLKLEFSEPILFSVWNSWNISGICEVKNSPHFAQALRKVYEVIPENHAYKIFQFFDHDDDPVVEVICKKMLISIVN